MTYSNDEPVASLEPERRAAQHASAQLSRWEMAQQIAREMLAADHHALEINTTLGPADQFQPAIPVS
jgi:hypothetical protein